MKYLTTLTLILLFGISVFSQEEIEKSKSIEESIDNLYKKSSSWEYYKVIRKDRFLNVKKEILDSLDFYKNNLIKKSNLIDKLHDSLADSKKVIETLSFDMKFYLDKQNEISFFGIKLTKLLYQFIVWAIIIIVLALLNYYIFRFKNSHIVTRKAQEELKEVEEELAEYRKKSIQREQKLRRQLQDEINKQRGIK